MSIKFQRSSTFPTASDDADDTAAVGAVEQLDPASVLACVMLHRTLELTPSLRLKLGKPGTLTTVRTLSAAWTALTAQAWGLLVHGGDEHFDGDSGQTWHREAWLGFVRAEAGRKSSLRKLKQDGGEALQRALWKGTPVVGFAPDEALLPDDLVQAGDYPIVMAAPSPADVAALAHRLCGGEPSVSLTDEEATALSPRLVRLARRMGQTSDDYVCKLRDLIAQDKVAPAKPRQEGPRVAPTLERLHGMDEAVAWGLSLKASLQAYAAGELTWTDVDHAVLVSGPPGTGKTTFARALAESCGVPLCTGSYARWLATGDGHQGDMLKAMRKVFEEAKKQAPCILSLDEVDSFPDRATVTRRNADWAIPVVNALLAELDGVEGREGVVIVAACNHPGKLDPALTRSGRLDRHIRVSRPDRAALALILREHLGADLRDASLSEATLAANGASGADCERFVRGARRRAREAGRALTLDDLSDEICGVDTRSEHEVVLAAVHEAGHAVMTTHLCPGTLTAVSVRATERGGGSTSSNDPASFLLAEDVHVRLVILLAGRAAEQVLLGVPSSGAGGGPDCDLALATGLATMAASALGFNTKVGLVWAGVPDDASLPRMLSEHPAIAAEVRRMLDMAYQDAMTLIGERQDALSALVKALLDRRALDGAAVAEIVARYPAQVEKALAP